MNCKNSAFVASVMAVGGLALSALADATPYDKVKFSDAEVIKVSASGTTLTTTTGTWNTAPQVADGKAEIDSDSTSPMTLNAATADLADVVATEVTFNLLASYVPASVTLATPAEGTKCGFAIKVVDTTPTYKVWNGSAWITGTGTPPEADATYTLTIRLDNRKGVGTATYFVGSDKVAEHAITAAGVTAVDFVGSGYFTGIAGKNRAVTSETIVINPGESGEKTIEFSPDQMAELKRQIGTYEQVAEKLNSTEKQANGLVPFDNYVLFGKVADTSVTDADKSSIKADPKEAPSQANGVVIKVPGFDKVQDVGGVTVTHVLKGSANGTDWSQVGESKTGANPSFEISGETPYRFFKVETTVSK